MKKKRPQNSNTLPLIPQMATTGRQHAFEVLIELERTGRFVSDLIQKSYSYTSDSSERAFVTELTNGVVRRQLTLDTLIAPHCKRPRHEVEPGLWILLRIGAYQLMFMQSVPDHAAISETIDLARWVRKDRWTAMANAILRGLQGTLTGTKGTTAGRNRVPLNAKRSAVVRDPVFADSERDLSLFLGQAYSYPPWLIRRWMLQHSTDEIIRLANWFNAPPVPALRVNLMKTTRDAVLQALSESGIEAEAGPTPECIQLQKSLSIDRIPAFQAGLVSVQDSTAMKAARLLDPQPGERILDLCAAPGSKTTHIAELMGDSGEIVAVDSSGERLERVAENCQRLALTSVRTEELNLVENDAPEGNFDAILLDVPCSNTGVMGKRPEVRWRIMPSDFEELVSIQQQLLVRAIQRARHGTRIVYSTCSFDPAENEQVVEWACSRYPWLKLVEESREMPGQPSDGGYLALLRAEQPDDANVTTD